MDDFTHEQTASLAKALGKQLEGEEKLRWQHTLVIARAAGARRI